MIRLLAFIISLLAFAAPVKAQGFTGVDLYKVCANPNGDSLCLAYVRGFSEGYYFGILLGQEAARAHRHLCYPQPPAQEPPDATQAELVVKKYLTDHPEELNKPAPVVVQDALVRAFNCRK